MADPQTRFQLMAWSMGVMAADSLSARTPIAEAAPADCTAALTASPIAITIVYRCGDFHAFIAPDGDRLALQVDGLRVTGRSASGARYKAAGDASTSTWSKRGAVAY